MDHATIIAPWRPYSRRAPRGCARSGSGADGARLGGDLRLDVKENSSPAFSRPLAVWVIRAKHDSSPQDNRNHRSCWSRREIPDNLFSSWREVSMQRVIESVLAAAILLGTAATTHAESVMKRCGQQWQAAKSSGMTNGATWPQFLAQCRAQLGSGAAAANPTSASTQPQTGSLFPWQTPAAPAPASTTSTAAGNQKPHETVWRGMASRKGSWNNRRRGLAAVFKSLPGAARLNDKRSDARRVCSGSGCTSAHSCTSGDPIGFVVAVAAASRSNRWQRPVDRRRITVGAASSVSLSRINGRLGQ